jgi:hypothetical protein
MQEPGTNEKRLTIDYFDGINSAVQGNLAKKTELYAAENIRSPLIGTLEKRRGQITVVPGASAMAENYGLFYFDTSNDQQRGVFKISAPTGNAEIYALSATNTWAKLSAAAAENITPGDFHTANIDGKVLICNGVSDNRMLLGDGVNMTTSTTAGDLYNSPRARKAAFYKGRIYLGDFTAGAIRYPTSVARSSYTMGIVALVNGDYSNGGGTEDWVIPVTDTKFFYSASGVNEYDVYRGGTKIASMTLSSVQETTITAGNSSVTFETGFDSFFSSDEIWITGTFSGTRQFRWVNNANSGGTEAKQYNTFKLTGGQEDPITLMETIGDILIIANKNAMLFWDDYTLKSADLGIGCVSHHGYVKMMGALFFIHYSGVYIVSGGMPKLLSRKVERYIKGATREGLEKAAMGVKGLSIFLSIGDVTLYHKDGSRDRVLKDVCLEYSVADENWYVHTNVPAKMFLNFIEESGEERLLYAHKGTGKPIKEFLAKDAFTDDGSEIFMRADTHEITFLKEFETFVNPIAIVVEMERGASMKCFISLDNDKFYEIQGTLKKGVSIIKVTSRDEASEVKPPLCRKAVLSFRDSSKQSCRMTRATIVFLPTTMDYSE